jgi:uncharacterized protein
VKIVFDTNIYISAFVIPGGNAEKAYIHAIDTDFDLCTSLAILTELAQKLEEKFGWEKQKIMQLIASISHVATVLKITPWLHLLSDEPDNRILECALKASADFVVTGDKHLLKLRNYENFEIITLATFLSMLHQPPTE